MLQVVAIQKASRETITYGAAVAVLADRLRHNLKLTIVFQSAAPRHHNDAKGVRGCTRPSCLLTVSIWLNHPL